MLDFTQGLTYTQTECIIKTTNNLHLKGNKYKWQELSNMWYTQESLQKVE